MSVNSKRLRASIPSFNNTTKYSYNVTDGKFDLTNHKSFGVQVILTGNSIQGSITVIMSDDGVTWGDFATATAFTQAGSYFIGGDANHSFYAVKVISTDTDPVVAEIIGVAKEN